MGYPFVLSVAYRFIFRDLVNYLRNMSSNIAFYGARAPLKDRAAEASVKLEVKSFTKLLLANAILREYLQPALDQLVQFSIANKGDEPRAALEYEKAIEAVGMWAEHLIWKPCKPLLCQTRRNSWGYCLCTVISTASKGQAHVNPPPGTKREKCTQLRKHQRVRLTKKVSAPQLVQGREGHICGIEFRSENLHWTAGNVAITFVRPCPWQFMSK